MVVHGAKRFASEVWSSVKGLHWDMGLRSSFEIPVRKGMRFRFERYGDVARMLYMQSHLVRLGKSFETGMLDLFCSYLSPGATVIDVGANVGMYSMAASRLVGPQGLVLAYEPDPVTFEVLTRNLAMNGCDNVRAFPYALSDREGLVDLSVPAAVKAGYVYGDAYRSMRKLEDGAAGIRAVSLDTHLEELGIAAADVMKIDVEGAELPCLRGAMVLLSGKGAPTILVECDEALCREFGNAVFDTLALLDGRGYVIRQLELHDWLALPQYIDPKP
jgi:FkbM family methyltransferase